VGDSEGCEVGDVDGCLLGSAEGVSVGGVVGDDEGSRVGLLVGDVEGEELGAGVGSAVSLLSYKSQLEFELYSTSSIPQHRHPHDGYSEEKENILDLQAAIEAELWHSMEVSNTPILVLGLHPVFADFNENLLSFSHITLVAVSYPFTVEVQSDCVRQPRSENHM